MAVYAPIYKDTIWTYDTPFIQYRIESPQGNVILEGRADTRPDGTPPTIYVNRLCEPFLETSLDPTKTGLTWQGVATRTFYLYNDLNDALLETYTFLRAYSGDWAGEDKVLSDPIKKNVSKDMSLPFTLFSANGVSLPMPCSQCGGTGGGTCDYYIRYSGATGTSEYSVTVGPESQTLTLYIEDTNIPYHNFPMGTLFHTHIYTGVITLYENPDNLMVEYNDNYQDYDGPGPNRGRHGAYDYTNENPPRVEYKVRENDTGRERTYTERCYVDFCSGGRTLIHTLTITQLP